MTLIYVARPIDRLAESDGSEVLSRLVRLVEQELTAVGLAGYTPAGPFVNAKSDPAACWSLNEHALRRADGMLALLPPGVPSVGVPMEIQTAAGLGKPVAVVGPFWSMQLGGMPGVQKFEHVVDAVRWLADERAGSPPVVSVSSPSIRWVGDAQCCPVQGYDGDAGFDLVVAETVVIRPQHFVDVDCGVRIELPEGTWAMITGRSSTLRKRGLLVHQGIIDNGYRGLLYAGVWNMGENKAVVRRGERVAQLIPFHQKSAGMRLERVEELSESDRGVAGFGSTGT